MRKTWGVLGSCLLLGCTGPRAVARPNPAFAAHAVLPPPAPTSSPEPAPAPVPAPRVRFEPVNLALPAVLPHVEVLFPIAGKAIAVPKASDYRVRLLVENLPPPEIGGAVEVRLDDAPPLRIDRMDRPIRLGDLVPEGRKVSEGSHRLFAVAVLPSGEMLKPTRSTSRAPFATVRFSVGARHAMGAEGPRLEYGQPRGTFPPGAIPLDFYVLGATLGERAHRVVATVTGAGGAHSAELCRWQSHRILGLVPGTYRLVLELVDPDGQPVAGPGTRVGDSFTVSPS